MALDLFNALEVVDGFQGAIERLSSFLDRLREAKRIAAELGQRRADRLEGVFNLFRQLEPPPPRPFFAGPRQQQRAEAPPLPAARASRRPPPPGRPPPPAAAN